MFPGKLGLVGILVGLVLGMGAFAAATPRGADAAVTDVKCDGVDDSVGLVLEPGQAADCLVSVDNDEAAVQIVWEGIGVENPLTLQTQGLTDVAQPPNAIAVLLQNFDADSTPDVLNVEFRMECLAASQADLLIMQSGTLPFGFVRFPMRCLGVDLFPPGTTDHGPASVIDGVQAILSVTDQDENGPLTIESSDGTLAFIATPMAACPFISQGPRRVRVQTDDCDPDSTREDLRVILGLTVSCPAAPVQIKLSASRPLSNDKPAANGNDQGSSNGEQNGDGDKPLKRSEDVEVVTCFPAAQPVATASATGPAISQPVVLFTPPSSGDAGLATPSDKRGMSLLIPGAGLAAGLAGLVGLRFLRP